MKKGFLIYPHQLFEIQYIPSDIDYFFIIEEPLYFTQFKFHKKKLLLHRASMKYYEGYLQKHNKKVVYIESAQLLKTQDIVKHLSDHGISEVGFFDLVDDWLERFVSQELNQVGITYEILESPGFICTRAYNAEYFGKHLKNKTRPLLFDYYKQLRIKHNILVENKKPVGGVWSLDAENRKKIPKDLEIPNEYSVAANEYVIKAAEYVETNFANNYGSTEKFSYAVTHADAKECLEDFLRTRFSQFGPYEDAIVDTHNFLFHSVLSPYINNGLLTPKQVLDRVIEYADKNQVPLESLEGFVRQVFGWREYMRGVYVHYGARMRTSNVLNAQRPLPYSFWTGTTGIEPVDNTVHKVLETAYAHHIPRLMVMGNFMNLCEIKPDDVHLWFMELFIDAYDWVMVPNVYAMSLYADGGSITTKPYISGSNYILKMSNYKKGAWTDIWDSLFWNFVNKHKDLLTREGRMSFVMIQLNKKSADDMERIQKTVQNFLNKQ